MRLSKLGKVFTHHEEEAFFVIFLEDVLTPAYRLVNEGSTGVADQNAKGFVVL